MIAEAEDHVVHAVGRFETELSVILREIEPSVVVFPFSEHRHTASNIVTQPRLRIQAELCAGLCALKSCLSGFDLGKENTRPDGNIRL